MVYLMIYQLHPKSMSSLYEDWKTNNSYFGKYMGTGDQKFHKNIRISDVTGFMIFLWLMVNILWKIKKYPISRNLYP